MILDTQNIHFTSDYHLGHHNVIKFDGRPFSDLQEMHKTLIDRWNSVVDDDDIVFYLGDLSYKDRGKTSKWFLDNVKGKIYFIMGNHDKYRDISRLNRFEKIFGDDTGLGGATISVKDEDANRVYQSIVMCHYPILSWNKSHYGAWHIHGHCHQSITKNPEMDWYYKRKVIDAGAKGWDYRPISYQEVKDIMSKKIIAPVDHHDA
jgi:calcineurin-like phosphoesterase family protein